ncbi:unnamed protein product [Parnassius apollo]|uniref:(apollo) hypothetical protein n=1 Tax=Parnassius apollo TaxID=110799 RepID=A0A8S3XEQ7_PARAO|nr:unnamed protein product [Parnassius apollo]
MSLTFGSLRSTAAKQASKESLCNSERMQTSNLEQRGNKLQVICSLGNEIFEESCSFSISGCATFQVRAINVENNNTLIFVRFFKNCQEDGLTYSITLSSDILSIVKKTLVSDDGTWHLIKEGNLLPDLDISIVMDTVHVSSFEALYNDTELTDFELRGEDGSVKVHKAVLAASSNVLRRMLSGSWRETTEGRVDVPGTSVQTLQQFKDYIYLRTLPDTGLEQILLLASYYMIPSLEQKCVNKLMSSLKAQNACDQLEFAVKHKLTRLVLAIFDCVQSGQVDVTEMRQHFLNYQDNICE